MGERGYGRNPLRRPQRDGDPTQYIIRLNNVFKQVVIPQYPD